MLNYVINTFKTDRGFLFFIITFLLLILYIDHRRFTNKKDTKISISIILLLNLLLFLPNISVLTKISNATIYNNIVFLLVANILILSSFFTKSKLLKIIHALFFFCIILFEFSFFHFISNVLETNSFLTLTYEGTLLTYLTFITIMIWFITLISYKIVDFILKRLGFIPDFDHMELIVVGDDEYNYSPYYPLPNSF